LRSHNGNVTMPGQGMNISMQDGFNLGRKLGSVLRRRSSPRILHTYSAERQAVAKERIDFDRKWAKMFSAPPKDPSDAESQGVDPREFQRYFGMRFHSAPVIRLADVKSVHLGHTVKADGRWRLFAFAAAEDAVAPSSRLRALCQFLDESPKSPARRCTPKGADIDSVIDVRAVFQQGHREFAIEAMPPFLMPAKGRYGLRDYERCSART
jgi:hypothetical protein